VLENSTIYSFVLKSGTLMIEEYCILCSSISTYSKRSDIFVVIRNHNGGMLMLLCWDKKVQNVQHNYKDVSYLQWLSVLLTGLNFYTTCLTINSSLHTMDGQNKHPISWFDRYAELYSGWDM
jgi:hypothetical protein